MSATFEGKILDASLRRVTNAIARTPDRAFELLKTEFRYWGASWETAVQNRFTGATGTQSLHGRSGFLRGSLRSKVDGGSIGTLNLRCVSAGAKYARSQQYGAEIRPVNKKALTIPLDANKSSSGIPRWPTVASLISAFGRDRVFLLKSKGKNPVIAVKGVEALGGAQNKLNKKSGLSVTPMFVLLPRTTIPGPKSTGAPSRLGFFEEWNKLANSRAQGLQGIARKLRFA